MTMDPGQMNKQIVLQAPTAAKDTYGVDTITYTTQTTAWAKIEPLRGSEYINAQQMQTAITHMVTIYYHATVAAGWRAVYGNRAFEIVEPPINIDEANMYLELMCVEKK